MVSWNPLCAHNRQSKATEYTHPNSLTSPWQCLDIQSRWSHCVALWGCPAEAAWTGSYVLHCHIPSDPERPMCRHLSGSLCCPSPPWNYYICFCYLPISNKVKVKVKESHYRPRQAPSIPGDLGSQISKQSAREGGKVVSPLHQLPLSLGNIPGTHFC